MKFLSSCKINLGLQILRKREDNYHDLSTVMLEIPLHDEIIVELSESDIFTCNVDYLNQGNNSLSKALSILRSTRNFAKIHIHLEKKLPTGAGLGAGSGNTGAFLKYMNDSFGLKFSIEELENIAAELGSDDPFFIKGGAQLCEGRGELMQSIQLDLKGKHVLILNPGIHISTALAFSKVKPNDQRSSLKETLQREIHTWKEHLFNDFEISVFQEFPEIEALKTNLYENGAIYASMSGSGASVFGIFDQKINFPTENLPYAVWVEL